ncbi:MAG: hypothetical protein JNL04_02930 [Rhodospirillaceae bacterium]|nr:hypothetical protein [Rhodospirillaceae bacterium]
MDIWFNNRKVADVTQSQIHLQRMVGAYELRFLFQFQTLRKEGTPRQVTINGARVSTQIGAGEHQLGIASLDAPVHLRLEDSERTAGASFALTLQPHQLSAIEELRGNEDLSLYLTLGGTGSDGLNTQSLQTKWGIPIARSRWLEMLRDARALDVLLVEVPMPITNVPEDWKKIRADLLEAQRHFHTGEFSACVLSCRKVIEEIGGRLYKETEWHGSRLTRLASDQRRDMTKEQREEAVNAAVLHFTHPAAHAEGKGGVLYTRSEAKLILTLAAAIAARA